MVPGMLKRGCRNIIPMAGPSSKHASLQEMATEISRHVPVQGTPLKVQHENGTVEPFASHELDAEVAWFERELAVRGVEAEAQYEVALELRRRIPGCGAC